MARIAVAGGAGAVGTTFVQGLVQTKHQVLILSRTERPSDDPRITNIKIDYQDVAAMAATLEANKIDTIISALNMIDEVASQNQLNLIAAADKSSETKRFIPSEFGVVANEASLELDPYTRFLMAAGEALDNSSLQYSRVSCGAFSDWWGAPYIDSVVTPWVWAVDVKRRVAAIPGTGDEVVSMTYTRDLVKFIIRLLDEAEWPKMTAVVGQDVTFNQMLKWSEEARGGEKFQVTYDNVAKLERNEITRLDETGKTMELPHEIAVAFGRMAEKGLIALPSEKGFRLNDRFPDLKVLTVEEVIKNNWTGRD